MEELIEKIEELIIVINNNSVPLWLSIVGILIPIFISIVVAIQAYIQHNSNKKLQMYISEKEARIQMHSDFLTIYDSFCIAQKCIGPSRNKIDEIFANPNFLSQWYDDLHKALFGLCQSTNRACLPPWICAGRSKYRQGRTITTTPGRNLQKRCSMRATPSWLPR